MLIGIAVFTVGLAGIGLTVALAPTNDATPKRNDTFTPSAGTEALSRTLAPDKKPPTTVQIPKTNSHNQTNTNTNGHTAIPAPQDKSDKHESALGLS